MADRGSQGGLAGHHGQPLFAPGHGGREQFSRQDGRAPRGHGERAAWAWGARELLAIALVLTLVLVVDLVPVVGRVPIDGRVLVIGSSRGDRARRSANNDGLPSDSVSVDIRWVRYGRPAAEALRSAISQAKGDEPLDTGDRRRPVQLRRRGHPPAAGLGRARSGLCDRASAWPPSPSSPSTAWPSFSGRLGWPPVVAGRSRRRSSPPRCGRPWPSEPGIFAPVADHAATETALDCRLPGAARSLRATRSTPWPARANGPPTSSASTGRPGPSWSRRSTTRRTCSTSAADILRDRPCRR